MPKVCNAYPGNLVIHHPPVNLMTLWETFLRRFAVLIDKNIPIH